MRRRRDLDLIAALSVGGALGALTRYGMGEAIPHSSGSFPTATFLVNVAGCLLLGVLLVFSLEVWPPRRLARPFLGTGVLGGFTTFSTYTVETQDLADTGHLGLATAYALGSLAAGLLAVRLGTILTRRIVGTSREDRE